MMLKKSSDNPPPPPTKPLSHVRANKEKSFGYNKLQEIKSINCLLVIYLCLHVGVYDKQ